MKTAHQVPPVDSISVGFWVAALFCVATLSCYRTADPLKLKCATNQGCPTGYHCEKDQGKCALGSAPADGSADAPPASGLDGDTSSSRDAKDASLDGAGGTGGLPGDANAGGAGGSMPSDGFTGAGGTIAPPDAPTGTGGTTSPPDAPIQSDGLDAPTTILPNGSSCATDGQCSSGSCVDGHCCDSKCTGNCESCSTGTCSFSSTPRKPCAGSGKCAGVCNESNTKACTFDNTTVCASQSCTGGVRLDKSICDGLGSCPTQSKTTCTGNQCSADGSDCLTCTDEPAATTCTGGHCGPTSNNCSHTVQCSTTCSGTGQTCGGGTVAGICGCTPVATSQSCGTHCGTLTNNCGQSVDCGGCTGSNTCGGGGTDNVCGCTPNHNACAGRACGSASDGCSGTVTCGTNNGNCQTGYQCNTTTGQCSCVPNTNGCVGRTCGTASDGCTGTITCGAYSGGCQTGYQCNTTTGQCSCTPNCSGKCTGGSDGCGNTCTNSCSGSQVCNAGACCTPLSSPCGNAVCGSASNGCGGTVSCGTCGIGMSCSAGSCQCNIGAKSACGTCLGWDFEGGNPGLWSSINVTLSTSNPGYNSSTWALSWYHYYTNDGSSGISMQVPLCGSGSSQAISISGISFYAKFVPDSGYGDFPNTTASKAILADANGDLQDSFTPFGGSTSWGLVSRTFASVSASSLHINLQAMDSWQGTVYIDNVVLTSP